MNKQSNKLIGLFVRYSLLLLIGINLDFLSNKILTPLTIYSSNALLSLFAQTTITGNLIQFNGIIIEIISACVATSAFFLSLSLILSTSEIKPGKRAQIIIISIISLFILNVLRIVLLGLISKTSYFEFAHFMFWHLISTIFVVGIWFTMVKIYKIKSIPAYSDIVFLQGLIKPRKKSKRSKKHK